MMHTVFISMAFVVALFVLIMGSLTCMMAMLQQRYGVAMVFAAICMAAVAEFAIIIGSVCP